MELTLRNPRVQLVLGLVTALIAAAALIVSMLVPGHSGSRAMHYNTQHGAAVAMHYNPDNG